MASAKIALGRVQTGSFQGDQIQKQARAASLKANSLETRVTDLETDLAALTAYVATLDVTRRGVLDVVMGNVNYTLTEAQMAYGIFRITGAHTAIRTLTLPASTDATARQRVFMNATSGGFAVAISINGISANVNSGVVRNIGFFTNGPNFLT